MPVLHSQRLTLRPFLREDLEAFLSIALEPDIAIIPLSDNPADSADTARKIVAESRITCSRTNMESGVAYEFAVTIKTTGSLIGGAGLTHIDHTLHRGELGFWISQRHRGQGYAREACQTILDFAFRRLQLKRITAKTEKENTASAGVLKYLGFTPTTDGWEITRAGRS